MRSDGRALAPYTRSGELNEVGTSWTGHITHDVANMTWPRVDSLKAEPNIGKEGIKKRDHSSESLRWYLQYVLAEIGVPTKLPAAHKPPK